MTHTDPKDSNRAQQDRPLRREIRLTRLGIAFTLLTTTLVLWEQAPTLAQQTRDGAWAVLGEHLLFMLIIASLIYGGLVYQFTRLGYFQRRLAHRPAAREALDTLFKDEAPALTVLVPSYKEERRVVLQTLLSAALQEYPRRRIALLIDDPPQPGAPADVALLAAARELPAHVEALLARPAAHFRQAEAAFRARHARRPVDLAAETTRLAALWREAAAQYQALADEQPVTDHTDRLFRDTVLLARRAACLAHAGALDGALLAPERLGREHRRLASLFDCALTSFERKRYVNLSHEANKAMNLNSYIALAGGHFRERLDEDGRHLEPAAPEAAELSVPAADYYITLDADSLLLPEYALRLIHLMEQPENARIAVAQTPYSAIPGAPGALERIAGATTDIQYIIHQGFTRHDATYWVGANALLRATALQEIAVTESERGFPVRRYIQDRTVIEDTESSVDLACRGWQLYNYPERLAYSATPPDFGSLIIQRRRWANGGLIILPKLLRYLLGGPGRLRKLPQAVFRIHYLISIAAVNVGLLILLAAPLGDSVSSVLLPFTALAYFLLYARDLTQCGYRASDVLRVYALNLLLLPVNLGGVLKSLQQGWTGRKIPFGRTPKVQGRTAAPALYIAAAYLLLLQWTVGAGIDLYDGHWNHAVFALLNASFLAYAIVCFVGLRESREDLRAGLRRGKNRGEPQPAAGALTQPDGLLIEHAAHAAHGAEERTDQPLKAA